MCAKKNPDEISLLPTRTRTNNDPRYQVPYVSVKLRYPVTSRCPVKATSGDICALHRRLSLFLANNAQSIWSRHDVVFACVYLSDSTRPKKPKKLFVCHSWHQQWGLRLLFHPPLFHLSQGTWLVPEAARREEQPLATERGGIDAIVRGRKRKKTKLRLKRTVTTLNRAKVGVSLSPKTQT